MKNVTIKERFGIVNPRDYVESDRSVSGTLRLFPWDREEVTTICIGTSEFDFTDRDVKVWTGAPGFKSF